jgi:VanZ family protein
MRTEPNLARLASLVLAVGLLILLLAGSPLTLPDPLDKGAHFAVFSLLTLLLWRSTGLLAFAAAAALAFGALDEWRQTYLPGRESDARDFLADLCGVLAAGTLILIQGKTACAESSPP